MKRTCAGFLLVGVTTVLTGCGSSSVTGQAASAGAGAASSTIAPTATKAPHITDRSGRPQVAWDPCNDIPDSVISQMGYRASSKDNSDLPGSSYTFLICNFMSDTYGLTVGSGNITFKEEQAKAAGHSTPITINGRQALINRDPTLPDSCDLVMKTPYGVVDMLRGKVDFHSSTDPCDGIQATARILEPLLPK